MSSDLIQQLTDLFMSDDHNYVTFGEKGRLLVKRRQSSTTNNTGGSITDSVRGLYRRRDGCISQNKCHRQYKNNKEIMKQHLTTSARIT